MMWRCMTATSVEVFCRFDGRMDSVVYCDIMNGEQMDSLEKIDLNPDDIMVQHDNDPQHNLNAT